MYCQEQSEEEIKEMLLNSPSSLLYVGGAMMKTHPELMASLLAFVDTSCVRTAELSVLERC